MAGIGYFRLEKCGACHPNGKGSGAAPDLTKGVHKNAAQMIEHFRHPAGVVPGSEMPAIQLSTGQLNALAAFLLKISEKNAEAIQAAPQFGGGRVHPLSEEPVLCVPPDQRCGHEERTGC